MLSRQIKIWIIAKQLPIYTPGIVLAICHWVISPVLIIYSCLVSENILIIGLGLLACTMISAVQSVYSGRCPLIYLERDLLDCPHWWRGVPFDIIAGYVFPMVVIWGMAIGLVRFIVNVLA